MLVPVKAHFDRRAFMLYYTCSFSIFSKGLDTTLDSQEVIARNPLDELARIRD